MEITEQFKQSTIEWAIHILNTDGKVTPDDILQIGDFRDENGSEETAWKAIASILATAHREGVLVAEYTVTTTPTYNKKVSTYHKPLNS